MLNFISIIFGAIVGSFLNVCICRIPKGNRSSFQALIVLIVSGQFLFTTISLWSVTSSSGQNVGIARPISLQYPLVEGVTALSSFLLLSRSGFLGLSFLFLIPASLIVITRHRPVSPDHSWCHQPARDSCGLIASFILPQLTFLNSLIGVPLGGGSLFLVATFISGCLKGGMGEGM